MQLTLINHNMELYQADPATSMSSSMLLISSPNILSSMLQLGIT